MIADGNGDFPLHVACASGHVAVVKELLPTAAGKGREEREKLSRLEQYTLESVRTRYVYGNGLTTDVRPTSEIA